MVSTPLGVADCSTVTEPAEFTRPDWGRWAGAGYPRQAGAGGARGQGYRGRSCEDPQQACRNAAIGEHIHKLPHTYTEYL